MNWLKNTLQKLNPFDEWVFHFIRHHQLPVFLEKILHAFTRLGDGYIWYAVVLAFWIQIGFAPFWYLFAESMCALGLSLFFYHTLKPRLKRRRPYQRLEGVVADINPLDPYSFPSGHTMNNLSVGWIWLIYFQFESWAWLFIFIPVFWGLLRIYFGVHWLTDIVGGVIIATFSAAVAWILFYYGTLFFQNIF